jgi:LPS export ABC transporter permease LptF/LPS export ABC transporter permease LptG
MFGITDRYLVREILLPLLLWLILLTFLLVLPPLLREGESLITKGVEWAVIVRVLLLLLPQALSITIPMAVLSGILVAFGRLSADREFVAMQACGVSVLRLLRPVIAVALVGTAATLYVMIIALPNANQTYREITFGVLTARVEKSVRPRVFFEDFPNLVLYVRDVPADGHWRDVFFADTTHPGETTVYLAKEGQIVVDREKRLLQLQLRNGTQHTTLASRPNEYQGTDFDAVALNLDPGLVFKGPPGKGAPEMTIAELRATIAEAAKRGDPSYAQRFMIQYKFSIPVASVVLALIGFTLGVSNRRDGKLASFVVGAAVVFIYYILLFMARALAIGSGLAPSLAPWLPNVVLGAAGIGLLVWRTRSTDQPIRISLPTLWRVRRAQPSKARPAGSPAMPLKRAVLVLRMPQVNLPRPNLIDMYMARQYLRIFVVAVVALLGIFYISTFIDLADKLFRGKTTTAMLLRYFFYQTPQFVYYVIPIAGLLATLVTIGVMTKNSELVVIKACGVSLYRTALPVVAFGVAASFALFGLSERVLAGANREADRLNSLIRGYPAQTFGGIERRWMAGSAGDIYHYDLFDPKVNRFTGFTLYDVNDRIWRLDGLAFAQSVVLGSKSPADPSAAVSWEAMNGWVRGLTPRAGGAKTGTIYLPFAERALSLEAPSYFKTEAPDAEKLTYGQLRDHIRQLRASGFNAIPQMVQLQRKVAFPFVTVIMTLLAVPFAAATGQRGALYSVGIGIVLAIAYWITLSIFGALGEGGVMAPVLAAWAPNMLFGAAALYMMLTIRT